MLVISHMYPSAVNKVAGVFVHNQVKALSKKGVKVCVVSPTPSFPLYPKWKNYPKEIEKVIYDDIPVFYVPTRMFPGGLLFSYYAHFYVQALKGVVEEIRKEFNFDIIHAHTIFPDGLAAVRLKSLFDVPCITTVHGSDIFLYPHRSKKVYKHIQKSLLLADKVIAVSNKLLDEARSIQPLLDGEVIYGGLSSDMFYPMDKTKVREKLGIDGEGKRILYVGNLYPVKGVSYLLSALIHVLQHVPGVTLDFVGDGTLRKELEAEAKQKGLSHNVNFHGRRPYQEIPLWINSADVVALPSINEGLSLLMLEAMGCGKPLVASRVGGIVEVLIDKETGLLCDPKDAYCLGNSLKAVLEDDDMAYRMGSRAHEISKQYSWERNATRLKNVYLDKMRETT